MLILLSIFASPAITIDPETFSFADTTCLVIRAANDFNYSATHHERRFEVTVTLELDQFSGTNGQSIMTAVILIIEDGMQMMITVNSLYSGHK